VKQAIFDVLWMGKDCSSNPLKMKIQFCSDLHLEFPENRRFLAKHPLQPLGDVLVLAGDVVTFDDVEKAGSFFDFVCDHYSAVYWEPGNHEYYGSDISDKPSPLCERVRDNLYLVNNHAVVEDGIKLVFTTLWSRISVRNEYEIGRCLSDFLVIMSGGVRLTTQQFSLLHEESLQFLKNALWEAHQAPTVVITHHVPTLMNYPQAYKNSPLTEAFAVELSGLIMDAGPACWIYGHHHVNTPEFSVGGTRMMTNQLGYVRLREHGSFRRDAVVEV
jgi:predicted phosphohydrolase